MVELLVDVHRAEGLLEVQQHPGLMPSQSDTYNQQVIGAVLQKHGVPRAQYDSSLMWYAQHLNLLTRVYGHVEEQLEEEYEQWTLQVAEARDFEVSEAGDSVQLWSSARHLALDVSHHSDIRFWECLSDSNFMTGDTLHWHFRVQQLLAGQQLIASASLLRPEVSDEQRRNMERNKVPVPRTDQPIGTVQQVITENGSYTLVIRPDSVQDFQKAILSLVLRQDSSRVSPVMLDSLSLLRTHKK